MSWQRPRRSLQCTGGWKGPTTATAALVLHRGHRAFPSFFFLIGHGIRKFGNKKTCLGFEQPPPWHFNIELTFQPSAQVFPAVGPFTTDVLGDRFNMAWCHFLFAVSLPFRGHVFGCCIHCLMLPNQRTLRDMSVIDKGSSNNARLEARLGKTFTCLWRYGSSPSLGWMWRVSPAAIGGISHQQRKHPICSGFGPRHWDLPLHTAWSAMAGAT